MEFFQDSQEADISCMQAVKVLKELNADNKRKLPEDVPLGFIPKRCPRQTLLFLVPLAVPSVHASWFTPSR